MKRLIAGLVALTCLAVLWGGMVSLRSLHDGRQDAVEAPLDAPVSVVEPAAGAPSIHALDRVLVERAAARLRPAADGLEEDVPWLEGAGVGETAARIRRAAAAGLPDAAAAPRAEANERALLAGLAQEAPETHEVAVLVLPVEFAGSETLSYQVHNEDGSECITVTRRFTGPLHGNVPYPGGTVTDTVDNQTVYYPSTEPEDYERLIFGRTGYTEPLRAGDPNVNGGAGVDISGLTVQSWFDAQSDGRVAITGTVAPWVALPHPEAYFGIDYCIPNLSPRAIPDEQLGSLAELTISAVEALKARGGEHATREYWARFDGDGDGIVDDLWIIHAGRGQEYGGGSEGETAIWSRAASLQTQDRPEGYVIHDGDTPEDTTDDIRLGGFTMLPEDSDLGVLVEEFGHSSFGLPDLYTTDASNSVGWWAPMSSGIWGGELGGSRPVNMPLWFRSVADCGGTPCGWADPVKTVSYTTPGEVVVIGRAGEPAGGVVEDGPYAGQTIHEGLRVDLPEQIEVIPNRAGEGGGAYSGSGSGSLTIPLDLRGDEGAASAPLLLTMDAHWNIVRYWGYAYVEVDAGDGTFVSQPDLDGFFTDDNPYGLNEGNGLTAAGEGTMRFDLSAYAGQEIRLRLRYFTYRGGPGTGWWVDDLQVAREGKDAVVEEPFDEWQDDWAAMRWGPVPLTLRHPHHYLVEWRDDSGFDASLRTAYQTVFRDRDEWTVDRVPANVPGALVMYRNLKYPFTGNLLNQSNHLPSWGPKYALLVVDPNFQPVQRPSYGPFSSALESLDAALALQDQPDYSLTLRHPVTGAISDTDSMAGRKGRARFDDARGAIAGLRHHPPAAADGAALQPWDPDGSVVLPSLEGRRYSTRVTDAEGLPARDAYGEPHADVHVLGSGDPGDDNVALGVHIEVIDQAADGRWGVVRVHNGAVDYRLEASDTPEVSAEDPVTYTLVIDNRGSVAQTVTWTLTMSWTMGGQALAEQTSDVFTLQPGESRRHAVTLPPEGAASGTVGDSAAVARFDDGTDVWTRRASITARAPERLYLPAALADAVIGEIETVP